MSISSDDMSEDVSVGVPIVCNQVRIFNDEILVKGSNVMIGYYMDAEATKDVFLDGWFKTGDTGYLDVNNKLFITGRKKNIIILENGENVSVEKIERDIKDIGMKGDFIVFEEINNEGRHYLVLLATKKDLIVERNIEDISRKLEKLLYKVKLISITERELIRTSTSKIRRKKCIENYIRDKVMIKVSKIIMENILNVEKVDLNTKLYSDLEIDSLDLFRIKIILEEEFGIKIDITAIKEFAIIEDIVNYIVSEYTNISEVILTIKFDI